MNKQEIEKIAKKVCAGNNWPCLFPISCKTQGKHWLITTNHQSIGCNVRILVSKETKEILQASFAPR